MNDKIVTFGKSAIQHGKHGNRAYLMSLAPGDLPEVLPYLDNLALTKGYTKIFAKVPAAVKKQFGRNGYEPEATIPGFYRGAEGVFFMGKYFSPERKREKKPDLVRGALETARGKTPAPGDISLDPSLTCRRAGPADTDEMAAVYRKVFATYPFPIHDPDYIRKTMETHVIYFGIWDGGTLAALASAETDAAGQNAEMTDFATLPDYRSKGLANFLLARLEAAASGLGIRTAFTIARSYSYGMNITFAKSGYAFSGTLTHNTQISGELESMNVWHKSL